MGHHGRGTSLLQRVVAAYSVSHYPSRAGKVSVLPSAEVTLFLADPVVVKVRVPDARQLPAMSSRIMLPLLPARRAQ